MADGLRLERERLSKNFPVNSFDSIILLYTRGFCLKKELKLLECLYIFLCVAGGWELEVQIKKFSRFKNLDSKS